LSDCARESNAVLVLKPGASHHELGNPVQRGHHFQRKADSNPVIADSG
jgi:hypothetical protein